MLIHRCKILRYQEEKRGNFTNQVPKVLYPAGTHCRFVPKMNGSVDTEVDGRTKVVVFYDLYLSKRVQVKNGDLVIWSFDPDHFYQVQEPYAPSNRYTLVTVKKEGEV